MTTMSSYDPGEARKGMREEDVVSTGEEYLKAWEHHDLKGIGQFLHPGLRFKEPLTEITGRESFLAFAEQNLHFVKEVRMLARFGLKNEAVFIYDFVFVEPIGACRTAAHMTFEEGRILSIELFYDPRHLEKMMAAGDAGPQ